jgi:hypothetical protein
MPTPFYYSCSDTAPELGSGSCSSPLLLCYLWPPRLGVAGTRVGFGLRIGTSSGVVRVIFAAFLSSAP